MNRLIFSLTFGIFICSVLSCNRQDDVLQRTTADCPPANSSCSPSEDQCLCWFEGPEYWEGEGFCTAYTLNGGQPISITTLVRITFSRINCTTLEAEVICDGVSTVSIQGSPVCYDNVCVFDAGTFSFEVRSAITAVAALNCGDYTIDRTPFYCLSIPMIGY